MAAEKDIKEFEEAIDFVRKVEMHCNEKVSKAFLMTLRAYRNGRKDLVDAYRVSIYGDEDYEATGSCVWVLEKGCGKGYKSEL
ncbi:hypothetical protein POTOM_039103 [Populus tomentosa]|uniref:Uncharacterized protein n=1 Tax=Populus tomentosa TaxID=118781 RepID=A0A8X7YW91_POPTO|nr:hypothetical protein POTOM_039103 [Populus tomentosa]